MVELEDVPSIVNPFPRRWRSRAAVWAAACSIAMVALALSLHHRANPWQLQLTVPSGLPEQDYRGYGHESPSSPADLSPDGRLLAVGRPDGRCEIWNLDTLRRATSIGDQLPPLPPEFKPGLGIMDIRWLSDGQHLALDRHWTWDVFGLDGSRVPLGVDMRNRDYGAATSPMGTLLACADVDHVLVIDAATGKLKYQWSLRYINSGNRRIDWTPDGRCLLMNDYLGVRVWDMRDGRLAYFHRELDLTLPPPMIADEHSGIEAFDAAKDQNPPQTQRSPNPSATQSMLFGNTGRSNFAALVDSRFAPGGGYFATVYRTAEMFGGGSAQTQRLRFYDTSTGNLIWDTVLPESPRQIAFSPDGSRLYVLLTSGSDYPRIRVIDTARRKTIADLDPLGSYPTEIEPLADSRWVAASGSDLWLVDTSRRCASLHLAPASPNTVKVLVRRNGMQLLDVGRDMTVRVFQLRRTPSRWGASALPETWGLYAVGMLLVLGMAAICAHR